jgi:hypothetical protein
VARVLHDYPAVIAYLVRPEGTHYGLVARFPTGVDGKRAVASALVPLPYVLRLQAARAPQCVAGLVPMELAQGRGLIPGY